MIRADASHLLRKRRSSRSISKRKPRAFCQTLSPEILADTTPLQDVLKFKEEFESKYGRIHPTFYQGSYSQAIEDAKKELRFLLVYLHSSEHEDTEQFCR